MNNICGVDMTNFKLISIWRPQKPANTYVSFHSHDFYELVYYVNANGKTIINNNTYNFKNGNFCIIPPGVSHDEIHYVDSDLFCLKFYSPIAFPPTFCSDIDLKTLNTLKKLFLETIEQKFGYEDMITARLTELCVNISRRENSGVSPKSFEFVINYIQENYNDKIVLRDCAERLSYNYDYFQHKFKRITGYSPQQFLINCRLNAAKELLKSNDISCTDIALKCGFSTASQFSTIFKEKYGITPKQYQKDISNKQ